jgi:hypothetical protein
MRHVERRVYALAAAGILGDEFRTCRYGGTSEQCLG